MICRQVAHGLWWCLVAAVAADLPAWMVCHRGNRHACGHDTPYPGELSHRTGKQWVSGVAWWKQSRKSTQVHSSQHGCRLLLIMARGLFAVRVVPIQPPRRVHPASHSSASIQQDTCRYARCCAICPMCHLPHGFDMPPGETGFITALLCCAQGGTDDHPNGAAHHTSQTPG